MHIYSLFQELLFASYTTPMVLQMPGFMPFGFNDLGKSAYFFCFYRT